MWCVSWIVHTNSTLLQTYQATQQMSRHTTLLYRRHHHLNPYRGSYFTNSTLLNIPGHSATVPAPINLVHGHADYSSIQKTSSPQSISWIVLYQFNTTLNIPGHSATFPAPINLVRWQTTLLYRRHHHIHINPWIFNLAYTLHSVASGQPL